MAFDGLRGVGVMTGGTDAAFNYIADTWEWDGDWHLRALQLGSIGPMAYSDQVGMVVTVGANSPGQAASEFAWNGNSWVSIPSDTAPYNLNHAVHDPRRARILAIDSLGNLFILGPTPAGAEPYGTGCGLPPLLVASGMPQPGSNHFELSVATGRANSPTLLVVSLSPANAPLGNGCHVLVGSMNLVLAGTAGSGGFTDFLVPIPPLLELRGLSAYCQGAILANPGAWYGLELTQGLQVRIGD
jgi:hypothetical protein